MRLRTVLEIGGLAGYSARNFCKAVGPLGQVITLDLRPAPKVAPNHRIIVGDATQVGRDEMQIEHVDLIFFDCHNYDVQMKFLSNFVADGLIDDDTVIALHDTNTHPRPSVDWKAYVKYRLKNMLQPQGYDLYLTADGWVHQESSAGWLMTSRLWGTTRYAYTRNLTGTMSPWAHHHEKIQ
jgi:predicted O-methyltransferase YrrM